MTGRVNRACKQHKKQGQGRFQNNKKKWRCMCQNKESKKGVWSCERSWGCSVNMNTVKIEMSRIS